MTDPVMLSVASTVADRAAEAAIDGGRAAMAALMRLVRRRLAATSSGTAALDDAVRAPGDQAAVETLARALEHAAAEDPGFAAHIRDLWPQVQAELSACDGGVVNSSTGTVGGHLIQARDLSVDGGLHMGDAPAPPPAS